MDDTAPFHLEHSQIPPQHRELLDQILDRWSLLILDTLCESPRRFNELRRAIPAVTQKSLTTTLKRLERNGMIDRIVLHDRPLAVEYRLSELGTTLQVLVDALFAWTDQQMPRIEEARRVFDTVTGVEEEG